MLFVLVATAVVMQVVVAVVVAIVVVVVVVIVVVVVVAVIEIVVSVQTESNRNPPDELLRNKINIDNETGATIVAPTH